MPRRKRQAKKKLLGKNRTNDAIRWLQLQSLPKNLIEAYSKRYAVFEIVAKEELISMGYYEEITIQEYEKEGVKWKYMVEPRSGELYLVTEDTEEHELYEHYSAM